MSSPRTSEFCLEVRLPTQEGLPISFTSAARHTWERVPEKLTPTLRTEALWKQIEQNWQERRGVLSKAGAALGKWLFDQRTAQYLHDCTSRWSKDDPQLRIEFRVPRVFAEYPWEAATLEGINHLAVHPALTVVRLKSSGAQQPTTPTGVLRCDVIGVALDHTMNWAALATDKEAERVRQEIEHAGSSDRFVVRVEQIGEWETLVDRYREAGAPHIFHFAGHGLEYGRGLVFRGADGGPEEVSAEQVAQLLTARARGRQTHLVFLNACTSSAAGKGPYQPFGGVSDLLIQHGIPMVVGLQTPVEDADAVNLAAAFYGALADGDTVDCALQAARDDLFMRNKSGVGWAFLNLTVAAQPGPLCQVLQQRSTEVPKTEWFKFGHREQRQGLETFLSRRHPLVVIVHGEEGSGHRYVMERVQFDLEKREHKTLWRPVAALQLSMAGNPLLLPSQLAGGIAHALSVPSGGTLEELENRLAKTIADRCDDDRVLVIDLQEVLKFRDNTHAEAVLTLIQEVWVKLMEKAAAYRSRLPVFLLLSVAYRRPLPEHHPNAAKIRNLIALTEQTVSRLQEKPRLKGNVRVEVLPKLQPFDHPYVARFLENALELDPDDAESIAEHFVDMNDNETILEHLKVFLLDRQCV